MLNITHDKNGQLMILEEKNLNKSISLVSCCNNCYNYKTINFNDIYKDSFVYAPEEPISYFNIDNVNGFEDMIKIIYIDNTECIVEVLRYYFEEI